MKGKGLISVLLGIVLMLTLTGCRAGADRFPLSPQENTLAKLQQLGFEDNPVDQVQLAHDGILFALSGGSLYRLGEGKWEPIGPEGTISTFHVSGGAEGETIIAGMDDGRVFLSVEEGPWKQADVQITADAIDFIATSAGSAEIYIGQSGTSGGGLWKGNKNGSDWEKLTDITVRGIAVHPSDPEILYIVDKLAYRSTNGGQDWHRVKTGANYGVFIHPLYPDLVYIAFAEGMVSARHNGEITSQQRFFLPGSMTRLEFNPLHLNEQALGIWDFPSGTGGLYYTFNAGADWLEVGEGLMGAMVLDLCFTQDGQNLYIGTADKGLWVLNIAGLKDGL